MCWYVIFSLTLAPLARALSRMPVRPPARPLPCVRVCVPSLYIHALNHVCTYTGSLSEGQSFDVDQGRKDSQHVKKDSNSDAADQVRETNEETLMQNETEPHAVMQKTNRAGGGERGGGDGGEGGGGQYDTANNGMTHRTGEGKRSEGRKEVEVWREAGRLEALRIIEFADQEARMLVQGTKEEQAAEDRKKKFEARGEEERTKESALLVDKKSQDDEAVHVDHGRSPAHARLDCKGDLTASLGRLRPRTPILKRLERSSMAKYGTRSPFASSSSPFLFFSRSLSLSRVHPHARSLSLARSLARVLSLSHSLCFPPSLPSFFL
jgi:hypothetical protein